QQCPADSQSQRERKQIINPIDKEKIIMAERRPLAAAVHSYPNADPEQVLSFVTQERHTEPEKERGLIESIRKPVSSRSIKRKPTRLQPVGLIPVTVRLRPEIAGALKTASLERQLAGEPVYTQQELVENLLE